MKIPKIHLSSVLFLCLIGLSFVLDRFGDYDYSSCCIAAAWLAPVIAAGASALGSIGSTIANWKSQADTNEANKQIAAENREWQSNENQLSRAWQEKMWNAQNQYNTPSAMKARLQEAGWNPFLANAEVGSASNAGSAGTPSMSSAPATPTMKAADFSGLADAGNSVAGAISSYAQLKGVDANSANNQTKADQQVIQNAQELYRMYGSDVSRNYLKTNLRGVDGSFEGSQFARRTIAETVRSENEARISSVNADVEEKFGRKRASNVIAIQEQTFNKISAEIGKMSSDVQVNEAKIKQLLSQYWKELAEAGMLKKLGDKYVAETSTINALRNGLVTRLENENRILDYDVQDRGTAFESDEGVRGYLTSKEGKENRAKNARLDNNRYFHAVERASSVARNWLPGFIMSY